MNYLLICDLDDTLTGDEKGIKEFNKLVASKKFCLAYSSGRYMSSMIDLIDRDCLAKPDIVISNVGTEIYYSPNWSEDEEWEKIVGTCWNEKEVFKALEEFDLMPQPYKKKFVLPFYADDESIVKSVAKRIEIFNAKVVHTKKHFLDVIPISAGKENAARYLGEKMKLEVICCGDSENDEEMLKKSDYGVLVGNAPEYLQERMSKLPHVYVANRSYALGVIEGLLHHGVIQNYSK